MPTTLAIPDAAFTLVATQINTISTKYGVPVLIRFGHEMNALIWAPNIGLAYPFLGAGAVTLPTNLTDPVNFAALDTNNDGVINGMDDPYGPYYPGDDVADWVGISLYWYPDVATTGLNVLVTPGYVRASISASVIAPNFNLTARNFYDRFAAAKNKPFALPESGAPWAPFAPTVAGVSELAFKQSWWQQIYNPTFYAAFPLLKLVVNFEEMKSDTGADPLMVRDWRIGFVPEIAAAYTANLKAQGPRVLSAGDMQFTCTAGIVLGA
eukprot:jgi/Hompol1/4995/HPOL_001097-RA